MSDLENEAIRIDAKIKVLDTLLWHCAERMRQWDDGSGSQFYWEGKRDQYQEFVDILELSKKKILESGNNDVK